MLYNCNICGKQFKQKGHYTNHLNRKNPCIKLTKNIHQITPTLHQITPNYTNLTPELHQITPNYTKS